MGRAAARAAKAWKGEGGGAHLHKPHSAVPTLDDAVLSERRHNVCACDGQRVVKLATVAAETGLPEEAAEKESGMRARREGEAAASPARRS